MKRHILCYLLCLSLILTLLFSVSVSYADAVTDSSVAKIGETGFSSLQAAIDAAEGGTKASPVTITLLKNTTEDILIDNDYVIIDLNGKTLTGNAATAQKIAYNSQQTVYPAVTVGVKNDQGVSQGGIYGVSIKNGEIYLYERVEGQIAGILATGSLTMENLTIRVKNYAENTAAGLIACEANEYDINNPENSAPRNEIIVSNCSFKITSPHESVGIAAGNFWNSGAYPVKGLTVDGCSIYTYSSSVYSGGVALYTSSNDNVIKGETYFDCFDGLSSFTGLLCSPCEGDCFLDLSDASGDLGIIYAKRGMHAEKLYIKGDISELFPEKDLSLLGNGTYYSVFPNGYPTSGGDLTYSDESDINEYPYTVKHSNEYYSDDIIWSMNIDGTLTVQSNPQNDTASVKAYSDLSPAPWAFLKDKVKRIIVKGNIGSIGSGAFGGMTNLKNIYIQNDLIKSLSADVYTGSAGADIHYNVSEAYIAIDSIGEVEYTVECWDRITNAKRIFDTLSAEDQSAVTNAATLTKALNNFEAEEKLHPSYSVVVYSMDLDGNTGIAKISGTGSYSSVRGADLTAYLDSSNDGYSFLGWYLLSSTGNIVKRLTKNVVTDGETTFHYEPSANTSVAAVYEFRTDAKGALIIPADSSFDVAFDTSDVSVIYYDPINQITYSSEEQANEGFKVESRFEKKYFIPFGTTVYLKSSHAGFEGFEDRSQNLLYKKNIKDENHQYTFKFTRSMAVSEFLSSGKTESSILTFWNSEGTNFDYRLEVRPTDTSITLPEGYSWDMYEIDLPDTDISAEEEKKLSTEEKVLYAAKKHVWIDVCQKAK